MTNKSVVAIKKIDIQIGDVSISLTPEEAKDLKLALDNLYPHQQTTFIPLPYPAYPAVRELPWYKYTSTSDFVYKSNNVSCKLLVE